MSSSVLKSVFASMVILLLVASCVAESAEPTLLESYSIPETTVSVTRGDWYTMSVYKGSICVENEELAFEADGVIENVYVYSGQYVHAGECLAELDSEQIRLELQTKEKELEQLKTLGKYQDRLAEIDIELHKADALQVEQMQLDMRQARELRDFDIAALQKKIQALSERVEKGRIIATADGYVTLEADCRKGQRVSKGSVMMSIASAEHTVLRIPSYLTSGQLEKGTAWVMVGSERYAAEIRSETREELTAMLFSGGISTTFDLKAQGEAMQPEAGQCAILYIEGTHEENVLQIPDSALRERDGVDYVYVCEDGAHVYREVELGESNGVSTKVISGLDEGETVYVPAVVENFSTTQVKRGEYSRTVSVNVTPFYPLETSIVGSETEALWSETCVKDGDSVKAGATIARAKIEGDPVELTESQILYEQALRDKEETALRLQAEYDNIEGNDQTARLLRQRKAIEIEMADYQAKQDIEARLTEYNKQLEETGELLLTAPYDGVISGVSVFREGDTIDESVKVCVLTDRSRILFETDNSGFRNGAEVTLETENRGESITLSGKVVSDTGVIEANGAIDPKDYSYSSRIKATVEIEHASDVLLIPRKALMGQDDEYFVYVKNDRGDFEKRYVSVGSLNSDEAWILLGLEENDTIAIGA